MHGESLYLHIKFIVAQIPLVSCWLIFDADLRKDRVITVESVISTPFQLTSHTNFLRAFDQSLRSGHLAVALIISKNIGPL